MKNESNLTVGELVDLLADLLYKKTGNGTVNANDVYEYYKNERLADLTKKLSDE